MFKKIKKTLTSILRVILPGVLRSRAHQLLRRLYRKPRQWTATLERLTLKAQEYAGYVVLYSEGTTLMSRLQTASAIYEPELVKTLCKEIRLRKALLFLDIGANIGLISLSILKHFPQLRIEAFDPGPHQYHLFSSTIRYNRLEPQIHLHNVALGDSEGESDFFVHAEENASGDGLVDTERAGGTTRIRVPVQRLDSWWIRAGKPNIPVVKIDTEGAELLVLKGAVQFLAQCKPTLFLEIFPGNLHHYPYTAQDILIWLNRHQYRLETLNGKPILPETSDRFWNHEVTFVAKPVLPTEE
jgi:FkbM family methyltransferase